jgi:hypothetical protein
MSENNILDLPLADFQAYLGEMRSNGRNTDDLVRMYRSHNSPFSAINSAADDYQQGLADSGRRSVGGGFLSKEAGATGWDALKGVDVEGMGGLLGALQALGQAFDAPYSAARNLIPQDDMSGEALGTAGLAMGGGGLAAAPRDALRSNSLMGGGRSDPTQTGWTFRDVAEPVRSNPTRSDDFIPMTPSESRVLENGLGVRQQSVPIRSLLATQDRVDTDFAKRPIDGERPLVIRKGGNMYIRDGHHRLTRIAEDGGSMADVDMIDLDNTDTSTPLLDYREPTQAQRARAREENDALFADLFGDLSEDDISAMLSANASQSGGLIGAGLSEAQRQARDILDMRAAGRAGDVTDEMMALADDQYMFANTPLDMGEAARMARAGDAGFDTGTPLYHGTAQDFPAFDGSFRGGVADAYTARRADWLTDSPLTAGGYADMAGIDAPVDRLVKASQQAERVSDWDLANELMVKAERLEQNGPQEAGQALIPAYSARPSMAFDADGATAADFDYGMRDAIDDAKSRGDVGAEFTQLSDHPNYGIDDPALHRGIFDPRNIRSRFARFDPEFAHLSNLSAANVSPTAGLLASGAQNPDKPLPFMEMLRGLLR